MAVFCAAIALHFAAPLAGQDEPADELKRLAETPGLWRRPPTLAEPAVEQIRFSEELREQRALIDSRDEIISRQQTQIDELRQAYDRLEGDAAAKDAEPDAKSDPTPRFGYENGFSFASPAGVQVEAGKVPFALRLNSFVQLRHTLFESQGPTPDQDDLDLERVRLQFRGHVYTPDLEYFMQLDGDSDGGELVDFLDYVFTYDFGRAVLGCDGDRLGIRAGKAKVPYNRARTEALWRTQLVDLSMASSFFDLNRSIGVGVVGSVDVADRPLNYETGIFNGLTTGRFRPGRAGELDRNYAYIGRTYYDLAGDWSGDGESDLKWRESPAVRVGAGFAVSRIDDEGLREFARFRVVDSGEVLAAILPPAVTGYDAGLFAVDANVKFRGLSLLGEYYLRALRHFSGAPVNNLLDEGFYVQAGYFVVPKRFELAARWSRVWGDSGTLGAMDQSADEISGGFGWYFRGHNAKLNFDVTHINGAPLRDTRLNYLPGDRGWMYRTQVQLRF